MNKALPPLYYGEYLQLEQLLDSQKLRSAEDTAAHDEMLFIIVHQVYELWFKQILHELSSVLPHFSEGGLDDSNMGLIVSRLNRITAIQKLLVDQLRVLETMTPLDFLDFRDYLVPASGFQSIQFRIIESMLGLKHEHRTSFSKEAYRTRLSEKDRVFLKDQSEEPSLFDRVEAWLERTPFLEFEGYNFWKEYQQAVEKMLDTDRRIIKNHPMLDEQERAIQLKTWEATRDSFFSIFDESTHKQLQESGKKRMSHRATKAALFIFLYRDYPALQLPHNLLSLLVDIDEGFTTWRQRHALMAHRMIGTRIGTGGSSGHRYLRAAAEKHKVFFELFDVSTYLLPRSELPTLPTFLNKKLRFAYDDTTDKS